MEVLFFGRYKEKLSEKIFLLLKKNFTNVDVIWSSTYNEKLNKKIKKKYHYIFTFRSYLILKKKIINKAQIAAINFHPGTPKYRGVGCANYAIFDNCKYYGATAHMINSKIDNGKIIDTKKFRVSSQISLEELLIKTHQLQYLLAKKTISNIIKKKNYLNNQINKNKNIKWSKTLGSKKKLDNFYQIKNINLSKVKFHRYLRSTLYKDFKPVIKIKGKYFKYDN